MIASCLQNRILLGVIGRPHGVRGLVRVTSHTADPADLTAYGPLSDDKGRRFVLRWRGEGVAEVEELVDGVPVKVADRTAAEKLTNTRLYVDRAQLPEPEDGGILPRRPDRADGGGRGRRGCWAGSSTVHDYGAGRQPGDRAGWRAAAAGAVHPGRVPEVDVAGGRVLLPRPRSGSGMPTELARGRGAKRRG